MYIPAYTGMHNSEAIAWVLILRPAVNIKFAAAGGVQTHNHIVLCVLWC